MSTVKVTKHGGAVHKFVEAYVKPVQVDDERWYVIKENTTNKTLFHFHQDQVESVTIDGVPFDHKKV